MRALRQQMIEIGRGIERGIEGLLDQLDLLADEPGRKALKRRIFLNIRNRVLANH
jgi:hypothetical protein